MGWGSPWARRRLSRSRREDGGRKVGNQRGRKRSIPRRPGARFSKAARFAEPAKPAGPCGAGETQEQRHQGGDRKGGDDPPATPERPTKWRGEGPAGGPSRVDPLEERGRGPRRGEEPGTGDGEAGATAGAGHGLAYLLRPWPQYLRTLGTNHGPAHVRVHSINCSEGINVILLARGDPVQQEARNDKRGGRPSGHRVERGGLYRECSRSTSSRSRWRGRRR